LRAAVLFGSVAWGDADEASDLDLMLLLDQPAGYREVTRLRVADLLGRPLPDGPRFIDLDRRSAQTFEEGEGRWFQRIVNSIILADTDGWYEGIRVQTTDEYATPACRRARWQDYAERANTERAALSRAREMGDGPLAALYGRLAVETAAAGLVDLHDDRVSLTHFIENVERALRARGKEALLPLVLQTFALEAVAAEDAERSLAAYRRFAGVLEAWMAEPDVVGRLSAEDAAWAVVHLRRGNLRGDRLQGRWLPEGRPVGRPAVLPGRATDHADPDESWQGAAVCANGAAQASRPCPSSRGCCGYTRHSPTPGSPRCAWMGQLAV